MYQRNIILLRKKRIDEKVTCSVEIMFTIKKRTKIDVDFITIIEHILSTKFKLKKKMKVLYLINTQHNPYEKNLSFLLQFR